MPEEMIAFLEGNATLESTPILKYILTTTDASGQKAEPKGTAPMRPRDNHAVARCGVGWGFGGCTYADARRLYF